MTRSVAPLLLLAACAPQSATLESGTLVAWLNEETSFTIYQDVFDPITAGDAVDEAWQIDCRDLEPNEEFLRLPNAIDVCDAQVAGQAWPAAEVWFAEQAWHGFKATLDPWRGEAVITAESDLQIGFHHRFERDVDFRFNFVITPDFNPTQCDGPSGNVSAVPVGGTPWLQAWKDVWTNLDEQPDLPPWLQSMRDKYPDGQLYLINARTYQIDPENLSAPNEYVWQFPREWQAGFARGAFAQEYMRSRPSRYGDTAAYLQTDAENFVAIDRDLVWYADGCPEGQDPRDCGSWGNRRGQAASAAQLSTLDLNRAVPGQGIADYAPIHIDNHWHIPDGSVGGLDSWQQLDYSWVVLSGDSDPTVGGQVRGAFSLLMEGEDSNSRFIIQGEFDVPRVRRDRWTGPDLYYDKLAEAGVDLCMDRR